MTSLFAARRRAEEFAVAVDGGPGGRPAADADLVAVATMLREHAVVTPRPEFSTDLRVRLMAEAETVLRPETASLLLPARTRGARERRLVAAASTVVLIGGTATMAAAAQDALPGEMLYPVKRGIEQADAGLNLSDADKGQDLLRQASARLGEVEGLLASDAPASAPQVPETLSTFTGQAREGSALLLAAFRDSRDPETVASVREFAAQSIGTLEALADAVPADSQDELADAAMLLRTLDEQASALCHSCAAELPDLQVPGVFLARAEVERVLETVAPRRLDNSHPVTVDQKTIEEAREAGSPPAEQAPAEPAPTGHTGVQADDASGPVAEDGKDPADAGTRPKDVPTSSPDAKDPVKELVKLPGTLVEDVTEGLDGVVKTLLPESDGPLGGLLR